MIQVKIIKKYKKMEAGDMPMLDDAYAYMLIKKGVAEDAKKPKAEKKQ